MPQDVEKSLDTAIKNIRKQFGAGAVMVMSESRAADKVEVISTGSHDIDEITGVGGIPRGRITEIFGPESSGKSTLCLQIIAQAQQEGLLCSYIDAEQALDVDYASQLGIDVDRLLVSQPSSGEEALEIALTLISSGAVGLVIVDSVAALVPKVELEGDMDQQTMGLAGRMMGKGLRKINSAVATTKTALVFINQIRDKLGIVFGNPEVTPGGRALKFYASLRIDVRRISQIKKGDDNIGNKTKVKVAKNKMAKPFREVETTLLFGQGFVNKEK